MEALSAIGSFAMLWVGGGILLHGLEHYGFNTAPDLIHGLAHRVAEQTGALGPVLAWAIGAVAAAIVAVIVGLVVVILHAGFARIRQRIRPS